MQISKYRHHEVTNLSPGIPSLPFALMVIPNILKHLVELTANVTNAFTVGLFCIDRERKHLVLLEHISLSRSLKTGVKIPLDDEGPIATVAATGKPVVIDNFKP